MPFNDAEALLDEVLDLVYFHPNKDEVVPIPLSWKVGKGNFVLVLGENASGKSFLRRLVQAVCHREKVEAIHLSMEGRLYMMPVARPFVYGDEQTQSTGENSGTTVLTGIKTCQDRDKPHVIFWDEPDLGLSDSWAAGMGQTFAAFAKALPEHTKAAFVVTHNRALVEQLVSINPHFIYVGDGDVPENLEAWLKRPIVPQPLEQLRENSLKRFRLIQAILNERKKT